MVKDKFSSDYDDDYATCKRAYATLCIYLPDQSDPKQISNELGIAPSRIQKNSEIRDSRTKKWPTAWFLSSDREFNSKDIRRHIDWLVGLLTEKKEILFKIQAEGGLVVINCFWLSSFGHGGPMLSSKIMQSLGELGIDIWFDVYFDDQDS